MTLAEFLRSVWLAAHVAKVPRGQLKAGSAAHYTLMAEKYVIPTLGDKRLRDLQPADLRELYANLGTRLAPKSVRNVHVALSNALSLAVSDGYIARNVAKAREVVPTARSREMQVWTPEQIRAFLAFVVDDRLYALWRLAATTGMRRGEMMGLHWAAVDLDGARLRVDGALIVTPARELIFEPRRTARRWRYRLHGSVAESERGTPGPADSVTVRPPLLRMPRSSDRRTETGCASRCSR